MGNGITPRCGACETFHRNFDQCLWGAHDHYRNFELCLWGADEQKEGKGTDKKK